MKIGESVKLSGVPFGELGKGEPFVWDRRLFLKCWNDQSQVKCNAVELLTGTLHYLGLNSLVEPRPNLVIVENET